jgi:hypothetical protein
VYRIPTDFSGDLKMTLRAFSVLTLFAFVFASSNLFGMGADHRKGDLPIHDGWGKGVYEAVNTSSRVHGFWINSSDTLFYRGANKCLEVMLQRLVDSPDSAVTVVIHAGKGMARSPWSKADVDLADWSVTISGKEAISKVQNQITVDIWLSGDLLLTDLAIPSNAVVKSGGEIEKIINSRTTETKK